MQVIEVGKNRGGWARVERWVVLGFQALNTAIGVAILVVLVRLLGAL